MDTFSFYYLVFIVFAVCLFLLYRLVHSSIGLSFQGVRENEKRMASAGYHTWLHKYVAFIIGGFFAGVAGVLFAYFGGIMTPDHLGVATSTLVLLMVILGGWTTFLGPVLGALVVLLLDFYASLYVPDRWPLILGAVFVLVVMFLPGGMGAQLVNLWRKVSHGFAKG
jgi:branched-chain amino acid transport system permease protein